MGEVANFKVQATKIIGFSKKMKLSRRNFTITNSKPF